MNNKLFILVPLIATLAACGGSSGTSTSLTSDSALSGAGTVSVLVTDNLTLDYSEVWVNIQSITATDSNGQTVSIYEDTTGQTHNLSQLANVGALVDAQAIPAGTYVSFEIVMANDIKLVDLNGNVVNATFDTTGNPTLTTTVTGNLTVDANQTATLALDFDLAQFTYDAANNTVTPVVVQKDPNTLNQTVTTTQGGVQAINSATQFIVTPATGGTNLTVNLHNNATVTNAATGAVAADTAGLQVGMNVSISGTYDPNTLTITASNVQIDNNSAITIRQMIEGIVSTWDGSSMSLDVKEASFAPPTNAVNVANVSNAVFSHGSLSLLSAGQRVEIKGSWDGNIFTAAIVEIQGASRNSTSTSGSNSYLDDYAELKGQITAAANNELTVTVQKRENVSGINVGDSVTIDSSSSWIEHGNSSCLIVGAQIEAKGPMSDASTMVANNIDVESGCNSSASNNSNDSSFDSYNDSHNDNHGNDSDNS